MNYGDYIVATIHRAKLALHPRHSDDWLLVALEANKAIARDREPRPLPATGRTIPYVTEEYPDKDCVTIAKMRENWYRSGGYLAAVQ